jgi:hypothetical protein
METGTHMRGIGVLLVGLCVQFGPAIGGLDRLLASQHGSGHAVSDADLVAGLAGRWKAPVEKTQRTGALDAEVFGPEALDVRNVSLTIEPSGEGDLQVSTSVVDHKGHTHVPSLVDVKLRIGGPQTSAPAGTRPTIAIVSAEERFLDRTGERFPLDGVRVTMTLASAASRTLELTFDTKDGRGSFGATLQRQPPVAQARRSQQEQPLRVGD